jgi:hypothetical protein
MAGTFLVLIKLDYVFVPVVRAKFACQGALYKRKAKNAANSALAVSPTDFVSIAGSVGVPKI